MAMEAKNKGNINKQGMIIKDHKVVKETKEATERKDVVQYWDMRSTAITGKELPQSFQHEL